MPFVASRTISQSYDKLIAVGTSTDSQAILHDIEGEEEDGGLEIVMPWLQTLHSQVRTCQFSAFWKEFNGSSDGAKRKLPLPYSWRRTELTPSVP
jgi:hypothetical protein